MSDDARPSDIVADGGDDSLEVSRRSFIKGAGLTIAAAGIATASGATTAEANARTADAITIVGPGKVDLELTLNGEKKRIAVEPSATLLDTLRENIGMTGAKRVCDRGSCGACTVIIDGRTHNACSTLAIDVAGKAIRTVEGFAQGEQLTPVQAAFVECDALQCGFCTPGMIVACTALLERNPNPSREDCIEALAGNLCRCGTYQNIFEAIELVKKGQSNGHEPKTEKPGTAPTKGVHRERF